MPQACSPFRTYELSLGLYQAATEIKLPYYLKDQLLRASLSISLNLAEGSAKPSQKERARFYRISLGSLREVQALIRLEQDRLSPLHACADLLGAHLYRLCKNT